MGAYRNRICQTPNLDRLARHSLIFNNAFTSASSCSPSRSALLTGQPSHQNGQYGLHQAPHWFQVAERVRTLPQMLHTAGIRTGLIGKKHVGPANTFRFDYERTEEQFPINQVGRNITNIKLLVREFLSSAVQEQNGTEQFFLIVSFHDPHRCGHVTPQFGPFCERWGSGETGMGLIPDWHPIYYQWDEIDVPYNVPDTEPARRDLAAQYTTISRLDQGVGLVLAELEAAGVANETLVLYTSDNGPPFPGGRTNLYEAGLRAPMFLSSPEHPKRRNQVTYAMTSLLDVVPTLLEWFNATTGTASPAAISERQPELFGQSLLPLLVAEPMPIDPEAAIFASQSFHEVTMAYPMRAIRTRRYKLIHNINSPLPFPIDQDLYVSPTFQDILNRTLAKQPLPWYKTLLQYYQRPEWELFDLKMDPAERQNLANNKAMQKVRKVLEERLERWQKKTADPWQCAPHGVLEDKGEYTSEPQCLPLGV